MQNNFAFWKRENVKKYELFLTLCDVIGQSSCNVHRVDAAQKAARIFAEFLFEIRNFLEFLVNSKFFFEL